VPENSKNSKKKPLKDKSKATSLNKKGITRAELKNAIEILQGNVSDIAKTFGYSLSNRGVIYRLIAKYNLVEDLKLARGYENRLQELTGQLAIDINLEALLSMNPKKLSKQDVVLLIFNLKALSGFIEAVGKQDNDIDDMSINDLIEVFKSKRKNDNE
jgi:hypothetical protein